MAGSILSTYSPEEVIVVISNANFSHSISGMAEGTFITITRETLASTLVNSASKNQGMRIRRSTRNGTMMLTLIQGSDSNDVLSQILANDEAAMDNSWVFSITVKDGMGRSVFHSPLAYVSTQPDISYGTEETPVEWTIQYVGLTGHTGGNSVIDPATVDTLASVGYTPDATWIA